MSEDFLQGVILIWLGGTLCLILWVYLGAWFYARRHRSQKIERDWHGGDNKLMGTLMCALWPVLLVMLIVERIQRWGRK